MVCCFAFGPSNDKSKTSQSKTSAFQTPPEFGKLSDSAVFGLDKLAASLSGPDKTARSLRFLVKTMRKEMVQRGAAENGPGRRP